MALKSYNLAAFEKAGLVPAITPSAPVHVAHRSVLHPGDFLRPGDYLTPENHLAHVILQRDGNLVLYRTSDGASLWASGTNGLPITSAAFQTDGNLVLRDAQGNSHWEAGMSGRGGASVTIQDDGNWVMVDGQGTPIWDTGTNGFVGTRSGNQSSFVTEAYNGISDAVDEAAGLISEIPGMQWATGLITDFAKTDLGKAFFRVVSPAAIPILWSIPFVGPIVAAASFALPGLARGEPLLTAYAAELRAAAAQVGQDILKSEFPDAVDEAEQIARQAGKIAGEFPDNVQKMLSSFATSLGLDPSAELDSVVSAFATKLGIREDIARVALNQVIGLPPLDDTSLSLQYDPATGIARPHKTVNFAALNIASKPVKTSVLAAIKGSSSAVAAVLNTTKPAKVSPVKAAAAVNLAHDVLANRAGSEGYAAHLLNGGGAPADTAAMASALANTHAIQVVKLYVDKYVGLLNLARKKVA